MRVEKAVQPVREARGPWGLTGMNSERVGLLALLVIAIVLVVMTISPFAGALFMAAVLAVTFHRMHERLSVRLNGHRTFAATLITTALVLAVVLPVVTLGVVGLRETVAGLDNVHQTLSEQGVEGLIRQMPEPLRSYADQVWKWLPMRERNDQFIFNLESRAATAIPPLLNAAGQVAIQSMLMVIAFFFLLLDGNRFMRWLDAVSPLHKAQVRELLAEFRKVSATVLMGSVATAAVQAAAAMVGYLIGRVPHPYSLSLLTFMIALIPVLGAGGFSFAVAVYMYLIGHHGAAIFLAIWSLLVVGIVDNIVKPVLLKVGIEMHGGIAFFTLIGGFAVFGPVGLVLGPMSVTLLLAIMRIYRRDVILREEAAAARLEAGRDIVPIPARGA